MRLLFLLAPALLLAGLTHPLAAQQPDPFAALAPRTIGPAAMSGRIVDLAVVERDPSVFYVASSTGGVWKTTTGGVTFEPVFQNEGTHSVGDIVVHQRDTSIVWVGTGERASRQSSSWGDGVYKSTDGGETWTHMGLTDSKHIGRVVLHPDDPEIVFVAAMGHLWGPNEERGLYRSTDGGASWDGVLQVDENTGAVDVIFDPVDPETLYAATYQRRRRPYSFHGGGPGSALWKSTDGGDTWTKLTHAGLANGLPTGEIGRIGIDLYRADPRIVYASIEQGERYNASTAYEERRAGIYRSGDGGETWTWMSDWNPRPMYASQITIDPNDDQRIYMVNSYSFSDDGGRTFTAPRQSLHGDDRLVWVNPANSRHLIKADDGGLGISWDRGITWLYATNLPVSQFYRVGVDNSVPYRVCGGLQDNGSWCGPSATYRSEGILNEDWVKWGGGDGFRNVIDTTDNRTLYLESQYLGLNRVDLVTGERTNIRPNQPEGFIGPRRNWTTWPDIDGPGQRLGNAMPPGNWDGPFIISPHDPNTIYAGLDSLYVSHDQGNHWRSLGRLVTDLDRRELRTMGELPDSFTLSLDDGIPYWPTLTEVAESPVAPGVLWVGSDDGEVHVSRDGGTTWTDLTSNLPGLPELAWINGIEPSRVSAGRAYLVANNYRNDDYANYIWATEDFGETWRRIDGDLPPERVARTLREDPRNPEVLYLGTEIGLFVSLDRGARWIPFDAGMPTMAFNDLVVHPRENDLILATHSRGIWIVDDLNAIQQMTPERRTGTHLFRPEPADQIRYNGERGHTGEMIFHGGNPPAGAILDFTLGEGGAWTITLHDVRGAEVARLPGGRDDAGLHRVIWNLRHSIGTPQEARTGPRGPLVVPGVYLARLTANGVTSEQPLTVREDPRIDADPQTRAEWTATLLRLARLQIEADRFADEVEAAADALADGDASTRAAKLRDLDREAGELARRAGRLEGAGDAVGPLTGDQVALEAFVREMLDLLRSEFEAIR
ncbi:MAG: hypothetical protein RQ745_10005 [Longimicrobiales bacterium]|nr:hypothetical protein [Longimicrobiales bacterium]